MSRRSPPVGFAFLVFIHLFCMKKIFRVSAIAVCMLLVANFANAQKIGYVSFGAVLDMMPERAGLAKQIQDFQKPFITALRAMQANYQAKDAAYTKTKAHLTKLMRAQKERELAGIQNAMQTYSTQAQQKVEAKQAELAKPMLNRLKFAVALVANEKGYTHVIDSTQPILLVAPDEDNLMAAVKAKLGLK